MEFFALTFVFRIGSMTSIGSEETLKVIDSSSDTNEKTTTAATIKKTNEKIIGNRKSFIQKLATPSTY